MIDKTKHRENAYMTIEAVLILPFSTLVICVVIGLMIFQYNRCLLEQDMGILAMWGTTLDTEDAESYTAELEQKTKEIYKDKYILWNTDKMEIRLQYDTLRVMGAGSMDEAGVWSAETEYKYIVYDPVSFIRMMDKLEQLSE